MSRIGKEPVKLADGVTATIAGQKVTVKGKLGELSYTMHDGITAKVEDGNIIVECADDNNLGNFHGLARALINANVIGVSAGYTKQLSIEGTGFKAVVKGKELALTLGFASPKIFTIPEGLTITVENDGLQVTDGLRYEQGSCRRSRRPHPRVLPGRALQGQGHQVRRRAHPPQTGQEGRLIAA